MAYSMCNYKEWPVSPDPSMAVRAVEGPTSCTSRTAQGLRREHRNKGGSFGGCGIVAGSSPRPLEGSMRYLVGIWIVVIRDVWPH